MQIFLFFALGIAIIAVAFALQNSTPVQVRFITWDFDSSLALVLLIALGSGALVSFLFSLPANLRARWVIRKQQKKLTELETGLAESRARALEAQEQIDQLQANLTQINSQEMPASSLLPSPTEEGQATTIEDPSV